MTPKRLDEIEAQYTAAFRAMDRCYQDVHRRCLDAEAALSAAEAALKAMDRRCLDAEAAISISKAARARLRAALEKIAAEGSIPTQWCANVAREALGMPAGPTEAAAAHRAGRLEALREVEGWLLAPSEGPSQSDEWNAGFDFLQEATLKYVRALIAKAEKEGA